MSKLLLIAIGGGTGAVLRYAVAAWGQRLTGGLFPVGTLLVNVSGCLLIGLAGARFAGPHLLSDQLRAALFIGLLGGYTTFSTFGWETFMLANDGELGRALANLLLTNVLGVSAVWVGYRLGQHVFGV